MIEEFDWAKELVNLLYDFKNKYNIDVVDLLNFLQTFVFAHVNDSLDEEQIIDIARRMYAGILEQTKKGKNG